MKKKKATPKSRRDSQALLWKAILAEVKEMRQIMEFMAKILELKK